METQVEKIFVKVNQIWQKGEAVAKDEQTFKVRVPNQPDFDIKKDSKYLEIQKFPAQQFAQGDVKERLEGAYISFDKLPENIQDALIKGAEHLHKQSYVKEGQLKETVKMVQMSYSSTSGSKLDVQIKRKVPVKLSEAKAFNHQFTKGEFDKMVKEGQHIVFTGTSSTGETFQKLAYYEPKLNDIRVKPALSKNTYFYGQRLTQTQARAINNGEETQITINTKKGKKTYLVSYSPKAARFVTKSVEQSKMNKMEVKHGETVTAVKKKKRVNKAMSL